MFQDFTKILTQAEEHWIPLWFHNFSDTNSGGFYERLDANCNTIEIPKRLLSQCRQIIVYSIAYKNTAQPTYLEKINQTFDFIKNNYFQTQTGGSVFSIDYKSWAIIDDKYDLYAHAFILMACSTYLNIDENDEIKKFAKATLNFITHNFRNEYGGFNEALDKDLNPLNVIRRQNPHMHLMEATLHMYEATQDKDYLNIAQELLILFFEKFYDSHTNTIGEFFNDDFSAHGKTGNIVETGHHAEWIWLLKRYEEITKTNDPRIDKATDNLFKWILKNGFHNGIYNSQNPDGKVIDSNKRIWPMMETMRAAAIMTQSNFYQGEAISLLVNLKNIFLENYINFDTGTWNEMLNEDLSIASNYLPATTPYHIYPVLVDIKQYLN